VSKAAHHIACSSETQAEIVLPVFGRNGEVIAVLDIDSTEANVFDGIDAMYLERICKQVGQNPGDRRFCLERSAERAPGHSSVAGIRGDAQTR
jgi:hypothetical protein